LKPDDRKRNFVEEKKGRGAQKGEGKGSPRGVGWNSRKKENSNRKRRGNENGKCLNPLTQKATRATVRDAGQKESCWRGGQQPSTAQQAKSTAGLFDAEKIIKAEERGRKKDKVKRELGVRESKKDRVVRAGGRKTSASTLVEHQNTNVKKPKYKKRTTTWKVQRGGVTISLERKKE